jgi:death-on-curing protein
VDGNKRAALLVTGLFLNLNGYKLSVSQADATMTVFFVAAGEMNEAGFAE